MADVPANSPAPRPPPPARRRWWIRLGLGVLAFVVVIVLVVQVVLWTSLPRNIVLPAVEKALGMRLHADSLSTTWWGETKLTNVTLGLPLADESFFTAPVLRVKHSWLPVLALTQSITLDSVELDNPTLVIRKTAGGTWNLADAVDLLGRAGGSQQAKTSGGAKSTGGAKLALPKVKLVNGTIKFDAGTGRPGELSPLNVVGRPLDPLTWGFDLSLGKALGKGKHQLDASGKLSPNNGFQQVTAVSLRDVQDWVRLVAPDFAHDLTANVTWRGGLDADNHVGGQLTIHDAAFDQYTAAGTMLARQDSAGRFIVEPSGITVATNVPAVPTATLTSGTICVGGPAAGGATTSAAIAASSFNGVTIDRLRVNAGDGQAQVDGTYDFGTKAATATVNYHDVALGSVRQSGQLLVKLLEPLPGQQGVQAVLTTRGNADDKHWDVKVQAEAYGPSFNSMDISVTATKFVADVGDRHADLSGSNAKVAVRPDAITLTSISCPGGALGGFGEYRKADKLYWLWLDGHGPAINVSKAAVAAGGTPPGAPPPDAGLGSPGTAPVPVQFMLNLWGKGNFLDLDLFYVRTGNIELTAKGYYVGSRPKPVSLNVSLTQLAPLKIAAAANADLDGSQALHEPPLIGGKMRGDLYVSGTIVDPLNLDLQAWFTGRNLTFGDRVLGDVVAQLTGNVDNNQVFTLHTDELKLLDGTWHVAVQSPVPYSDLHVDASVADLPLEAVGQAIGRKLGGTFQGRWSIDLTHLALDGIVVNGAYAGTNLQAGPAVADTMNGTMKLLNGDFNAQTTLRRQGGLMNLGVDARLASLDHVKTTAQIDRWPYAIGDAGDYAIISGGDANLDVDVYRKAANGTIHFAAVGQRMRDQYQVANLALAATLQNRLVQVDSLTSHLLGGQATGTLRLDLDKPLEGVGEFEATHLDLTEAARLDPGFAKALNGFSGTYDGAITIRPDHSPRAIGPLQVTASLTPTNARYQTIDLGPLNARAYVDTDPSDQAHFRAVLDQLTFNVAGGTLTAWSRAATHAGATPGSPSQLWALTIVNLKDLDLQQLVPVADPKAGPTPGRISGSLTVNGQTGTGNLLNNLSADGDISVYDSDLANFGPFAAIYNIVHAGTAGSKPTGHGQLGLDLQNGTVSIDQFEYFNRGIDLLADAQVHDIFTAKDPPLTGTAAGSARPFADINLPLFADLDEATNSLQSQVTPLLIVGTLHKPNAVPAGLASLGSDFRQYIVGNAQAKKGAPKH